MKSILIIIALFVLLKLFLINSRVKKVSRGWKTDVSKSNEKQPNFKTSIYIETEAKIYKHRDVNAWVVN